MIPTHLDRVLVWATAGQLFLAAICAFALRVDAPPILGVHPALKPMKFAFSIALFLGTMAILLPALSVAPGLRQGFAWVLALTMVVEMVPIVGQALRGTTSHFNVAGRLNAALWQLMMAAIVIATLAMTGVALAASTRELHAADGAPMNPLLAWGWRAGLWLFLFAAVSGFAMGGRLRHSVGGEDGGPGLPVVNWSLKHGDLRVSHFVALHALQSLPVIGALLAALPIAGAARWSLMILAIAAHVLVAVGTFVQAMAGRPLF